MTPYCEGNKLTWGFFRVTKRSISRRRLITSLQANLSEEDRVVVIRFGHDWDSQCMKMDETLSGVSAKVQNFAVIYLVLFRLWGGWGVDIDCGKSRMEAFVLRNSAQFSFARM